MKRFERVSQTMKRRVKIGSKQETAQSLLELSDVGSDTAYCESHSCVCTMTDLAMTDLDKLEADHAKLSHSLQALQSENLKLIFYI